MTIFFLLVIPLLIWLELTYTTLPLLLIALTILVVLHKNFLVFAIAFLGGLFIDSISVRPLGITSLFLVSWLFLCLLYERKYEINSLPFVFTSSLFGSSIYLLLHSSSYILFQALISAVITSMIYVLIKLFSPKRDKMKLSF